jgi:hypothetical protein
MDTNSQEEKNDSQRVGIDRFTLKLHSKFSNGGTKNKCYKILVFIKSDKGGKD